MLSNIFVYFDFKKKRKDVVTTGDLKFLISIKPLVRTAAVILAARDEPKMWPNLTSDITNCLD